MIHINSVVIPTKGTAKYLDVKVLSFDISPTDGIILYWSVHDENGLMLLEGNINFPQEQYDSWGTDDSVVSDWVMTELGFTEVQ
jgi:hypothetical protein